MLSGEWFSDFTTAVKREKRDGMERQTTPCIAGQTSRLRKSFSPQKEKFRIAIKTTVPRSPRNFTPNTYASAAERLVKNKKFALCTGWRQRLLARLFHPELWLVHLNLSARWQHDPPPEGNVHLHDKMYNYFRISDFPMQFSIYTSCRIHHVLWAWGACGTRWL